LRARFLILVPVRCSTSCRFLRLDLIDRLFGNLLRGRRDRARLKLDRQGEQGYRRWIVLICHAGREPPALGRFLA